MLEILQLYVSGFWVWVGITLGVGIVYKYSVQLIVGVVASIRGVSNVYIGDVDQSNTTHFQKPGDTS